ncbi:hypothetical protein M5689_000269 [Euphorbia peplus]|nr:hypothetical protein M5689_000269 [Euphorbia peplus]
MDECGVFDLGCSGNYFTWRCNNLFVRLDKVYSNNKARLRFHQASVTNLPFRSSDHCPILFWLFGKPFIRSARPFWYLLPWETHPDFKKFVADHWQLVPDPIQAANNF